MLEQSADVPPHHVAHLRVLCVRVVEERLAIGPVRLVGVHARPVVSVEGLRHEGRGVPALEGDVLDDVLVHHDVVGHLDQGVEPHVDFTLAASGHFVMLRLDGERRDLVDRVDDCGGRVGDHEHVRLVDLLPTADR